MFRCRMTKRLRCGMPRSAVFLMTLWTVAAIYFSFTFMSIRQPINDVNPAYVTPSGDKWDLNSLPPENITTNNKILLNNSANNSDKLPTDLEKLNSPKSKANGKRLKILLVTIYRSGSSFMGELLKNNPDSFYAFEPLFFVGYPDPEKHPPETVIHNNPVSYLENLLFNCDVTALKHDSPFYTSNYISREEIKDWIPRAFPGNERWSDIHSACASKRDVAAKVIRLYYLKDVIPRLTSKGAHVIYLIRDPRGILSSRIKIDAGKSNLTVYLEDPENLLKWTNDIKELCGIFSDNLKYLQQHRMKNGEFKFQKQVIVVRYEDFAYRPQEMTTLLYKFLGIPLPKRIQTFIDLNTRLTNDSGSDPYSPYSVVRDSSKTANAWRSYLPFDFINKIQTICSNTLKSYGYDLASEANVNNYNVSFVLPIPKDVPGLE